MAEIEVEVRELTIIGADRPTLDEVVLTVDGVCLLHLEQIDDRSWFMGIGDHTGSYVRLLLATKRAEIHGTWFNEGDKKAKLLQDGKEIHA